MTVAYNKFNLAVDYLVKGQVDFSAHTFKVMLTNTAPVATNSKYADISATEVANLHGYVTGGSASAMSVANVTGTETITAADVTFTASGGTIGPFQYAVLYDATNADKSLWCWFDYGAPLTLSTGDSFVVEPNAATPNGTLFTMA